ncbi:MULTISPECIES: hypothetical protein [Methylobacter]
MNALTKIILVVLSISSASVHANERSYGGRTILQAFGLFIDKITGGALTESRAIDDSDLVQSAEQINKQLPKAVDKDTRLDYVKAGPGLNLTYNYTLVGFESTSKVDEAYFLKNMRHQTQPELCSNMKILFNKGVTITLSYQASNGSFYPKIIFTPKDCGYVN